MPLKIRENPHKQATPSHAQGDDDGANYFEEEKLSASGAADARFSLNFVP
jgi:hypothetical protein